MAEVAYRCEQSFIFDDHIIRYVIHHSSLVLFRRWKMSGDFVSESDPNYNFKGYRKYLNSYTKRGRLNVSIV